MLEFGPDEGLQGQVVDIVRMLLDPDSMDQSPEKDPFLELFYEKYVGELVNLLIEGAEQNQQSTQAELDAFRREEEVSLRKTHNQQACCHIWGYLVLQLLDFRLRGELSVFRGGLRACSLTCCQVAYTVSVVLDRAA